MSRRTGRRAALLALLALAWGCAEANPLPSPGTDTGVPPVPGRDEQNGGSIGDGGPPAPPAADFAYIRSELTYVSSLPTAEAEGTVVLVGEPDAISEPGTLRIVANALGVNRTLTPDAAGSFSAVLENAFVGLDLVLQLVDDDDAAAGDEAEVLAELELTVRAISGAGPTFFFDADSDSAAGDDEFAGAPDPSWEQPAPGGNDGARTSYVEVTAPDGAGIVRVRTTGAPGITPFARVLVVRLADGQAHAGRADSQGTFEIAFSAAAGDRLSVFAAAPDQPDATTQAITLTVPAD